MATASRNSTDDQAGPGRALLLTVRQVAELLQCSPRLVWRLVSEGQLRRVTLGPRCVRFLRAEVEAMIEALAE